MNSVAGPPPAARFNEEALKRGVKSVKHPLTRALVVLTFTTGMVDAVSYLAVGRVFTANMTGNVVLLGFALAHSGGLPVVAPIISLAAFIIGSSAGGVLVRRTDDRHPALVARALGIEIAMLIAAAIVAAAASVRPNHASGDALIALLAFAMGVRSAAVRRIGVPDLSTVVLTMTLSGLASQTHIGGGSSADSIRRLSGVIAMLAGAVGGALLLKIDMYVPLVVAAALALATCLLYLPAAIRLGGMPSSSRHDTSDAA